MNPMTIVTQANCQHCKSEVTEIDLETGLCEPCLLQLFESWFNDFLTVEKFAEYHLITTKQADLIISHGRTLWNERAVK